MRIITLNANSIRSAGRKGFFTWMQPQNTDIISIQETKTQLHQLSFDPFFPANYHRFYHGAEKKDSSGLALYCRNSPIKSLTAQVVQEINTEDRFIEAQFGNLTLSHFTYLSAHQRRRPTSLQG